MPPSWNFNRVDRPEWMDTRTFPPEVVRETLRFLSLTHRRFGGADVVTRQLEQWGLKGPLSLLDAGTGGGDVALAAARWARKHGVDMRITAVDRVPEIAEIARENLRGFPEIEVRCGDAFAAEPHDIVTASLFLHHVPPRENLEALRRLDGLAKRGMILSDLLRSLPSYLAVWALSVAAGNPVVRHDGPLSVLRAFTVEELTALAREAELPHLKARREPWFRTSLSGVKP